MSKKWTQIETLFHAAMEKPNARREGYLRSAANNNTEYEESLRLVKSAEAVDDFMSTSIGLEPFSASLAPGDNLGNWQINAILGSGGMGEVYAVRRKADDFEHKAALKLARTKDVKYLARFEKERQILAKLEHPNIGRLIDGGVSGDGQPYFVMELIEAQNITSYVATNNLSQAKRLELFTQLCRAVSHAHSRLILHRDLKPANVLISEDGQVKLIDFGVSDDMEGESVSITAPVTKAYAAPEQLSGKAVSTQTDIYALGSLLHEILADERLDVGQKATKALATDLQYIIDKCRNENPSDRYASVDALNADLDRFMKHEPVAARGSNWTYRASKFISRYKLASAASALFVISLMAGLGGTYTMLKRAETAQFQSVRDNLEQEFEARAATGYRLGLQSLYGDDSPPEDKLDPKLIDKSMLRIGLEVRKDFNPTDLDTGFMLFSMGQNFMYRYDWQSAADMLEPLEDVPMSSPILTFLSFQARSDLARCLVEIGEKERAATLARQLLIDRETHTDPINDIRDYAYNDAHVQDAQTLAAATGNTEDEDNVIDVIKKTIDKELSKKDTDDDSMGFLYNQLASALYRQGKEQESLDPFAKSFEYGRKSGINFLDDVTPATNLAQFQIYLGEDGESPEKYLPDYLPITSSKQGSPGYYALVQGLRAHGAMLTHRWDLAEETSRLAMEKIANQTDFRTGWYYRVASVRARALTRLERYAEARKIIDTALTGLEQENKVSYWEFHECRLYLAKAYLVAFESSKTKAAPMFDTAEAMCKAAATRDWSKETIMQKLIARMRHDALE